MDSAEYAERAVDESALGADGIAAEVGGKVVYFSNQSELSNFAAEQIEWESKIGPVRPKKNLAPEEPASAWTEGAKTVLFMRVDFSDRPGEPTDYNDQPLTLSRAQNLFTNEVNPFYMNNSYNKTSLQATVTPVLRLPQTQAFYTTGSNYNIMITDARNAASQAGFNTSNFNLDIVGFSYTTRLGWVGLASIGAKGNLLNGAFYMQETSHELGHNYGLLHANLWRTTDGTIIGQGNNVEYGDCFDVMGACYIGSLNMHFNTRYKLKLDWLTDANVQTVTSNGVYRIIEQDSSSPGGIRTLKIRKDDIKNYWVEFRQLSPTAVNGALIRWDYLRGSLPETQLLDMNPATTSYFDSDAPLLIGQSFYDSVSQIRITVIGKGNTNPESLDVNVELGQSTGGCTYTLSPTSANISVSGGTGSVNITAPSGCSWTASANQTFVTITSGSSGSSNGTINYSVAANTGSARSATITIAGQIFTIQQAGATIGSYTLVASPITIAPGGQLAVSFTAPGGSSLLDWVALYRVGALNTEYLDGGYTNGATSGTFNLTAPTQPGQYEFRYLLNNTFTSVITSNTITVQSTPTPSPTPTPPPTPSPTPSSEVTSVGMSPSVLNLQVGASSQIQATARDANGQVISDVPFLWSSRNASIASVDQSGNVTGVSPGTTTIIATTPNGTHNPATVTVTPATPTPSPTPIPAGTAFITSKQLGTPRNDYSAWFGMKVTIGSQPITVRSLGRIFLMGNSGTHTVKIVRASDSVDLASALVSMTGGISGEFKYADLTTPVTLQANTVYYIASQEAQGGDAWCDDQTTFVTSTSAANVDGRAYNFGGGWSSGGAVQGNVLIPVDFRYDTASALTLMPSPSTIKVDSGILIKALTGWFNNTYNISGNKLYDYPSTATPGFADNPPLSVLRGVRFNSGAVEYDTTGLSPGTTYKVVI
ncbi:MAG: Ig-like domain-containing protein [Acidobacteria bacterium]|nr:Ig-like domain-containing protein [Acidobacteriota bacterium]